MMKKFGFKLRYKLVLALTCLSLAPFFIALIVSYTLGSKEIAHQIGVKLEAGAVQVIDKLEQTVSYAAKSIQTWADVELMQDILVEDVDGRTTAFLQSIQQDYDDYSALLAIDPKGQVIASSRVNLIGQSVPLSSYQKGFIGNVTFVEQIQAFALPFSAPIHAAHDPTIVIGFLIGWVSWDRMIDQVANFKVGETGQSKQGYAVLTDHQGFVIAGPSFTLIPPKRDLTRPSTVNMIELGLTLQASSGFQQQTMASGQSVLVGMAATRMIFGKTLDWHAFVIQDEAYALSALDYLLNRLVVTGVIVALLILIVAFGLGRAISQPILKTCAMAKAIASGQYYQVEINSHDEIGQLAQTFNQMSDSLKQTNQALIKARDQAIQGEKAKTEFLSNMSHELRTPMNGVLGMLSVLMDEDLTPQQAEYAQIAKQSSEALLVLLNDLLDFAKIDSGKMTIENIPFNPQDVLENVVDIFSGKAREQGLELILKIHPNTLPKIVEGDPNRIVQILNNLVSNAIKFTQHGHVIIEGNLVQEDEKCHLYCAVEDTGIGIPEEKRSVIFDKFSQADASTTRQYGGTGLGLTISRQLVGLMGGEMDVDCPAQGSRFWFTIPLTCDTTPHMTAVSVNRQSYRILVVDDNIVTLDVLSQQLLSMGFRVDQQAQPENALNMLLTAVADGQAYHMALIDEKMPSMSGIDLFKQINAQPKLKETAVILLCTECNSQLIQNWTDVGISGYIGKPIKLSALVTTVEMLEKAGGKPIAQHRIDKNTQHFDHEFQGHALVVDDNEVNRMVAMTILDKFGLQVNVVESGEKALESLKQTSYDLIFMDCQMPGLNGFETTEKIREQNTSIPIIAMTANVAKGTEQQCLNVGMNGYISKPVNIKVVENVLTQWLTAYAQVSPATLETQRETDDVTQTLQEVLDLFGAERFYVLAKAILDNAPKQLNQVVTDWEEGQYNRLKASAHLLKGTFSVLKAAQLCRFCEELEANAETSNVEGIAILIEQIKTATTTLLDNIARFIQTGSAS